ncbi:GTPase Rab5/YPT51, small G protein superfamily GTPase [Pseudoloma neurophilia]|uniref:GTPase Rab5/YPT51, small G protein superfamily GTPase n=1 Tax=Pseudoloma neurophilia TaxID=146866 RepID=A0A0R0M191_9MICR|nr:GTPase Rab5/YPT51, small G protein superfamily GTPase [Pseudoloma neurophilia]
MALVLNEKQEYRFKLCLLGYYSVGKSSILRQYISNSFDPHEESTIGGAFTSKKINYKNQIVTFDIWDTAGQERYNSLAPMYYRNANASLIVFDITSLESFSVAQNWVAQLKSEDPKMLLILIGNKCDLDENRQVSEQEIFKYSQDNNLVYYETSAKTKFNIENVFSKINELLPREPTMKENKVFSKKKKYVCC